MKRGGPSHQIPMATGEFAYGASLSALGPVILPDAGLLSELNAPKGNPRMRTLFQFPEIVPCASASRRAGLPTCMEQFPTRLRYLLSFGDQSQLDMQHVNTHHSDAH